MSELGAQYKAAERVERGAGWLDTARPGWWTTFDLDRFSLADGCACVVGQLAGHDFDDAVDDGWLDLTYELAFNLGLFAGPPLQNEAEYQALEDEWRRVIAERRS
jgi:hypothetical protein